MDRGIWVSCIFVKDHGLHELELVMDLKGIDSENPLESQLKPYIFLWEHLREAANTVP